VKRLALVLAVVLVAARLGTGRRDESPPMPPGCRTGDIGETTGLSGQRGPPILQ
jgi:hypothetical protein